MNDRRALFAKLSVIYAENDVDLTLIRENLRRPPTERLRRADARRRVSLRIQEYVGRAIRIEPRPE